ncbi:MAG: hypothetical protein ACR2MD_17760 [Aridibacter sp.]
MEKLVIRQNSVKQMVILLLTPVAVFAVTTMFLPDKFLYWTINISVVAGSFLWIIFERRTTIICDQIGCAVEKKRFWENSGKNLSFNQL